MGIVSSSVVLINSRSPVGVQGSGDVRDTAQHPGSPKDVGAAQIRNHQKMLR